MVDDSRSQNQNQSNGFPQSPTLAQKAGVTPSTSGGGMSYQNPSGRGGYEVSPSGKVTRVSYGGGNVINAHYGDSGNVQLVLPETPEQLVDYKVTTQPAPRANTITNQIQNKPQPLTISSAEGSIYAPPKSAFDIGAQGSFVSRVGSQVNRWGERLGLGIKNIGSQYKERYQGGVEQGLFVSTGDVKFRYMPTGTIFDTQSKVPMFNKDIGLQNKRVFDYVIGQTDLSKPYSKIAETEYKTDVSNFETGIKSGLKERDIITQQGIDVGLYSFGEATKMQEDYYANTQKEFDKYQTERAKSIGEKYKTKWESDWATSATPDIRIVKGAQGSYSSSLGLERMDITPVISNTALIAGSLIAPELMIPAFAAKGGLSILSSSGGATSEERKGLLISGAFDIGIAGLGTPSYVKGIMTKKALTKELETIGNLNYELMKNPAVEVRATSPFVDASILRGTRGTKKLTENIEITGKIFKEENYQWVAPQSKGSRIITGVITDVFESSKIGKLFNKYYPFLEKQNKFYTSAESFEVGAKGLTVPIGEKFSMNFPIYDKRIVSSTLITKASSSALVDINAFGKKGLVNFNKQLYKELGENIKIKEFTMKGTPVGGETEQIGKDLFKTRYGKFTWEYKEEELLGGKLTQKFKIKNLYPNEPKFEIKSNKEINKITGGHAKGVTTFGLYSPTENKIIFNKKVWGMWSKENKLETLFHERGGHFNWRVLESKGIYAPWDIKGIGKIKQLKILEEINTKIFPKLRTLGYTRDKSFEEMGVRIYQKIYTEKYLGKLSDISYEKRWVSLIRRNPEVSTSLRAWKKIYETEPFQKIPIKNVIEAQLKGKKSFTNIMKTYGKKPAELNFNIEAKDWLITKTIPSEKLRTEITFEITQPKTSLSTLQTKQFQEMVGIHGAQAQQLSIVKESFSPRRIMPPVKSFSGGQQLISKTFSGLRGGVSFGGLQQTKLVTKTRLRDGGLFAPSLTSGLRFEEATKTKLKTSSVFAQSPAQQLKGAQLTKIDLVQRQLQPTTFTPPPMTGGDFGLRGFGFTFPPFPFLGGEQLFAKPKKKGKKRKTSIKPSFTAEVFNIVGKLPKSSGRFGVSPFQIRKIPRSLKFKF